jgi:hypothetical protein
MNHARLATSARLQRALRVLQAHGDWMTKRQILRAAHVCAVNSVIAALRTNGADIETKLEVLREGRRRYRYRLVTAPEGWNG